ncbi:uncharacterized protein KQ657_000261 [Scheffersomyces spartinae]|uniref:Uncharacterized protein n=1 Tax=Scheffersomyces spartinae TaxID=45513 RepID=A0A9P8AKW4_9ASCO|nr:uncharacterized protein KQ657_000261 [Scheffersomyces spartinae]KAG7196248.1 hypothetical protein KQ657_000261 [Scheffersomyces spartinae]
MSEEEKAKVLGVTPEQTHQFLDIINRAFNPNHSEKTQNTIKSIFDYIQDAVYKMEKTDDRDKTSKEIVEDLGNKFKAWADGVKKREEQRKLETEGKKE